MESNNENPQLDKYQQEQIDKINWRAKFIKEQTEALSKNEAVKEWLKNFRYNGFDSFYKDYATQKSLWIQYGAFYEKRNEENELQWLNNAQEHIGIIQQKKLFDLQCLWRAEKITLPGVEIRFDFNMWESDILNCPFLEPVTEEDIELYQAYLQDPNCDLGSRFGIWDEWQNYDEIKEAYNTNNEYRDFPEWYEFYNGRRGTGAYMLLPDIRGDKEEFYRDIWFAHKEEEAKKNGTYKPYIPDERPILYMHDSDQLKFFVSTFEDKETQRLFKAYTKGTLKSGSDEKENIDSMIELLMDADEYVPIEGHYNWLEALTLSVKNYKCKKISEALPEAYSQYRINVDSGISFPKVRKETGTRKVWADSIIAGRILNGEPGDFNF